MTILQISKQAIFLKLIYNLVDDFDMGLAGFFGINQNVVKIYNNKSVKLFGKNLIDVALKSGRSIRKFKKYDLILKMIVLGLESYLSFIVFTDFYLMIRILSDLSK